MAGKVIQARLKEQDYALLEEFCRRRRVAGRAWRISSVVREGLVRLMREEFGVQEPAEASAAPTVKGALTQLRHLLRRAL